MRRVLRGAVLALLCGPLVACTSDPEPVEPVTPTARSSSSTTTRPSPTPTVSLPLSPFEEDPAVQAVREHLRAYALAVNAGADPTTAELTATSTATRLRALPDLMADETGLQYPGPVPATPIEIVVDTADRKDFLYCMYNGGYAVDPATGEPPEPLRIEPGIAVVVREGDHWLVDGLYDENLPKTPDCSAVSIQEEPW